MVRKTFAVFVGDALIWDKDRLPNEQEAAELIGVMTGVSATAAQDESLSAGVATKANGTWFLVYHPGEDSDYPSMLSTTARRDLGRACLREGRVGEAIEALEAARDAHR